MEKCFGKVLKDTMQNEYRELKDLPLLAQFQRVLIEDSTKAQLHENLSPHFKGCGGAASKAELKINFIFDYLSEQFLDLHFVSGVTPDQTLSNRIFTILEKGDLVVRDLVKICSFYHKFSSRTIWFRDCCVNLPSTLESGVDIQAVEKLSQHTCV